MPQIYYMNKFLFKEHMVLRRKREPKEAITLFKQATIMSITFIK